MHCSPWSQIWPKLVFHPIGAFAGYMGYKIGRACCPNSGGENTIVRHDPYAFRYGDGSYSENGNIAYSVIFGAAMYITGQAFLSKILGDTYFGYVARAWSFSCSHSDNNSTNANSVDSNNNTDSSTSSHYRYIQNNLQDSLYHDNSTELLTGFLMNDSSNG